VGPFRAVAFKTPSTLTEDMYLKSLDATLATYQKTLSGLEQGKNVSLPDVNFDTGRPSEAAQYKLTDDSYAYLMGKLADRQFDMLTADLRDDIQAFYSNPQASFATKRHKNDWAKLQEQLQQLRQAQPVVNSTTVASK
jgi:hypothetical protein